MLEEIIDSKNDASTLSFFLSVPERAFSVLEVSKRLSMSYLKASHSLNNLTAGSVLKSFSKKNKKYYILNNKYKLLPSLKSYWLKNGQKYDDELFVAIKKLGDVKAAFLSGLFCAQPNLPVDLLIVGKINLNKLAEFIKALETMMGQEINYSIMTVEEFTLRKDTFDRFIKDIFDYPHLVVVDNIKPAK